MGGAPPLPHDFAPQGGKNRPFLAHFAPTEDQGPEGGARGPQDESAGVTQTPRSWGARTGTRLPEARSVGSGPQPQQLFPPGEGQREVRSPNWG